MIGQTSAKCDQHVCRVCVTLENVFLEKKHSVTRDLCTNVTDVIEVTRVTNVTQFCDPVTQVMYALLERIDTT